MTCEALVKVKFFQIGWCGKFFNKLQDLICFSIGLNYLLESHCCKVSKVGITTEYPLHCSPFRVEILVILTALIAGLFILKVI